MTEYLITSCPLCGEPMERLAEPRDREFICRNMVHARGDVAPQFDPTSLNPMFAHCKVCGELHECGKVAQWKRCRLSDKGLLNMIAENRFLSSGYAHTIYELAEALYEERNAPPWCGQVDEIDDDLVWVRLFGPKDEEQVASFEKKEFLAKYGEEVVVPGRLFYIVQDELAWGMRRWTEEEIAEVRAEAKRLWDSLYQRGKQSQRGDADSESTT